MFLYSINNVVVKNNSVDVYYKNQILSIFELLEASAQKWKRSRYNIWWTIWKLYSNTIIDILHLNMLREHKLHSKKHKNLLTTLATEDDDK